MRGDKRQAKVQEKIKVKKWQAKMKIYKPVLFLPNDDLFFIPSNTG